MNRKPPVLATWLLERFGVKRQNEALMGDLAEEYQAGRSWAWYWWQTLVAIFVTVIRDVREHKLLALRAVAMSWILWRAFPLIVSYVEGVYLYPRSLHWAGETRVAYLAGLLFWRSIQWVLIGWLVGRAHRAQAASMVIVVAAFKLLLYTSNATYYIVSGTSPWTIHVPLPSWYYLAAYWPNILVHCVFMIGGALLVRPKAQLDLPSTISAH